MATGTSNPAGSTAVEDLLANTINLDNLSVGTDPTYTDRLGVERKSISGFNAEFQQTIEAASGTTLAGLEAVRDETLVARDEAVAAANNYDGSETFLNNTSGAPLSTTVYESSYWTSEVLDPLLYCKNRLKRLVNPLTAQKGIIAGNSVAEGTGASSSGWKIGTSLQFKLQNFTGIGSFTDWETKTIAIGSTTAATAALALSQVSSRTASTIAPSDKYTYTVILSLRNEPNFGFSSNDYAALLEQIFLAERLAGRDVIFITEPPLLTGGTIVPAADGNPQYYSNGVINENANFIKFKNIALSLCGKYGATVIDAWQYFIDLADRGVDITYFSFDGIHPNDHGFAIIDQMLLDTITKVPSIPVQVDRNVGTDYTFAVQKTSAAAGSVTALTNLNVTKSTARKALTGETVVNAYVLNAGDTVEFDSDDFFTGWIFEHVNSAGTAEVYTGGVLANTSIQCQSTAAPGGFAVYGRAFSTSSRWKKAGRLRIKCVSGTINVTAAAVICSQRIDDNTNPVYAILDAGWADGTLTVTGENCKQSSTIDDELGFYISGSQFSFLHEQGTNQGIFELYIDGTLTETIDCYAAGGTSDLTKTYTLSEGQHFVKIKVLEKNASSSGNLVKVARAKYSTNKPLLPQIYNFTAGASSIIAAPNSVDCVFGDGSSIVSNSGKSVYVAQDSAVSVVL